MTDIRKISEEMTDDLISGIEKDSGIREWIRGYFGKHLNNVAADARRQGAEEFRKRVIEALKKEQRGFLSEEYAINQPVSSVSERLACDCCIKAVEALPLTEDTDE